MPAAVRAAVLDRDQYRCQAPVIDPTQQGQCRDAFGTPIRSWPGRGDPGPVYIQMSHTPERDQQAMSKKAPTDARHLISLCPFHHTGTKAGSNWEATHREDIRDHLGQ